MRPVFKVLPEPEWADALKSGVFSGSAVDRRDGFIHFSTAKQLAGTLARHFSGMSELVLLEVDGDLLGEMLRWEVSRNDELFPHLYGSLLTRQVRAVYPLSLDTSGTHLVPEAVLLRAASMP